MKKAREEVQEVNVIRAQRIGVGTGDNGQAEVKQDNAGPTEGEAQTVQNNNEGLRKGKRRVTSGRGKGGGETLT